MIGKFFTGVRLLYFFTILVFLFPLLAAYPAGAEEIQYRQMPLGEYQDKVEGGWLGQAIGVLWGQWTEGKWQGEMVPFDLEDWYKISPSAAAKVQAVEDKEERAKLMKQLVNDKSNWVIWTPDEMSDQDDLYVEFMFQHAILKHGLDVTGKEIAEEWVKYLAPDRIWCANKGAYQNFIKGIWPPMSGNPRNTIWGDAIDFQIESDFFGLISPGLPRVSNEWGDRVGHIMNYGDGVYAGMAVAAMYGQAFFESNPRALAEYSLRAIPTDSKYAQMVRDVLDLQQRMPDWKDAWQWLERKYGRKDGNLVSGVDVVINGAYIYMGLLYGGGDFWKTMNISMRCGRDSDCNPSSSAGILGTVLGLKGIPQKWTVLRNLPIDNKAIREIYPPKIKWDGIIEKTIEVGRWNVLENGGYIEKDVLYIPYQDPDSPPLEQTAWEEPAKR